MMTPELPSSRVAPAAAALGDQTVLDSAARLAFLRRQIRMPTMMPKPKDYSNN